ncbi:putative uncharacterized protein DDB_G0271606 [Eupeodes corollae]|uniref:putative uncharacterized protein DDB_G0271606 n=1 Tax=Eupeodes corollae TaxID=290404 RepID=UPI0024937006|nr:putative uncharacterized protein DDB_G0271606 [Eupeodes corollae]
MEKERNSSGDANVVPSAVHKFTATSSGHQSDSQLTTTNVKRKLKPNLVERNNAAKRGAMRQGVQQKKQHEMTSQSESSDGDIDYVSEGGEGHYRSPTNKNKNRFSSLAPPEQPKEREMKVTEAPNDNEADEVELAQVLQAKKQQIDAYEDQLKKLKEEMEPLLSALRNKIEARRQKEAAEKEDKQAQRLLQQQQQQQAKQKKPETRQQQQPQQQQPKPATKITGAEQKIKTLPAVTGPMPEGPSTSSKAKQQQQQELQQMEKERNSSGDANVVPSAVHKFTATSSGHQSDSQLTTTNVKRKLKPNLVERNNAAKRGAMRQGVQQKKQHEMTSQSESSDGDIDYVSEGGEGHYRSPTNKNKNRFSSLAPPEQPKEREMKVTEAPNDNEADEVELAQVLQAKKQQIDAYEDQLKKLKEEMEPLLSALRNKIEARRQKEAAEKEDKQAQRLLQQQQQQQAKQKKPETRQQQQPQQQQPKPATKITGAEQKIKTLPAVTGPMPEGPSTSSKAKQQQQQELQARQQQQKQILGNNLSVLKF